MAAANATGDERKEGIEGLFDSPDLDAELDTRTAAKVPSTGKTVLVVDDSEMMRLAVCTVVRKMGHTVVEAADGTVGLSLANRLPDLVLLDLNLPAMDGMDVLRAMRNDPKLNSIPVIILTMKRERQNVRDAVAEKVVDFLLKPVPPTELRRRIRKYIG